ncbi:MAG: MgtC/SapB family protein [Paludibacter sp.]
MMQLETEQVFQILGALGAGAILGLEREYHNKPAGLRTMILISVSSCLFSILSVSLSGGDRIASNIVTGIGFIGAGVVFKEGNAVKGITSATLIWMAAAIGMSIGLKHYGLASLVVLVVLLVLVALTKIELVLDNLHQIKAYEIHFESDKYSIEELEKELMEKSIHFDRIKTGKQNNMVKVEYNIDVSPKIKQSKIDNFFITNPKIIRFDV